MAQILLCSDIHIHTHKNSLRRLQHCLDTLEWIFQTAVERDIDDVVFLGDLFQDRMKIQVLPYQRTYEIIEKYCGRNPKLNFHVLVGNHDMWYSNKTDISSVYPLGSIAGVHIINSCESRNIGGINIDFLPYTLNPLESLKSFALGNSDILCGHISLDGAQLNTFYKTQADVSVEYDGDMVKVDADKFSPWKKVFLGHYHGEQRIKHVEYVGSPLQLNFAEAFQQKHIVILNTETFEQEYVINDFSPKHLIISEDEVDKYDLDNTFVKIIPKDITAADLAEMRNDLMESNEILTLEFSAPKVAKDDNTKNNIEDAQNVFAHGTEEMLEAYIKAVGVPEELDFDILLETGKILCQESQVE